MTNTVVDPINLINRALQDLAKMFLERRQSSIFDFLHKKSLCLNKYSAYGFILGDSTIIPRKNYSYIEIKSTKLFTIIAGLYHVSNIATDPYLSISICKL